MRRHLLLLPLLAMTLLFGFAPDRSDTGPYEYKFVRVGQGLMAGGRFAEVPTGQLGEQVANSLGRQGWELDQIDTMWVGSPSSQFEALTLVFKRPQR